jgi:hypothetical protein
MIIEVKTVRIIVTKFVDKRNFFLNIIALNLCVMVWVCRNCLKGLGEEFKAEAKFAS